MRVAIRITASLNGKSQTVARESECDVEEILN